jgi:hypothetical protein
LSYLDLARSYDNPVERKIDIKKEGDGYLRFLNSISASGVVVTYWNPFSIRFVASLVLVAALHLYSSFLKH